MLQQKSEKYIHHFPAKERTQKHLQVRISLLSLRVPPPPEFIFARSNENFARLTTKIKNNRGFLISNNVAPDIQGTNVAGTQSPRRGAASLQSWDSKPESFIALRNFSFSARARGGGCAGARTAGRDSDIWERGKKNIAAKFGSRSVEKKRGRGAAAAGGAGGGRNIRTEPEHERAVCFCFFLSSPRSLVDERETTAGLWEASKTSMALE